MTIRRVLLKMLTIIEKSISRIEHKRPIKGLNSIEQNIFMWNNYDWKNLGEEWSKSEKWKDKFIEVIINSNIKKDSVIVEIGPGAGRWTESLIKLASKLYLIEISETCLDICRKRFSEYNNVNYNLINKINLDFIEDKSIDYFFSFDVFVHLDIRDVSDYFKEFKKKLKDDGKIIVHYSKVGDKYGNFYSKYDRNDFEYLVKKYNFEIVNEYDRDSLDVLMRDDINQKVKEVICVVSKKSNSL